MPCWCSYIRKCVCRCCITASLPMALQVSDCKLYFNVYHIFYANPLSWYIAVQFLNFMTRPSIACFIRWSLFSRKHECYCSFDKEMRSVSWVTTLLLYSKIVSLISRAVFLSNIIQLADVSTLKWSMFSKEDIALHVVDISSHLWLLN